MNELDPDLQFIFEEHTKNINFLGINVKIIKGKLHFNVYHKPTNSFSYLCYKNCQSLHTKKKLHYRYQGALCKLLLITQIIDFQNVKVTY